MKIRAIQFLVIAMLLIGGCSDTVTNHYPTRAKAEADNLFERGWLPSIIPTSARDITISNDLDINISEGEFRYDPKQTHEFLAHLKPYSGQKPALDRWRDYIAKQRNEGYDCFEYTADKRVWVFLVNSGKAHVLYVMWLQQSS